MSTPANPTVASSSARSITPLPLDPRTYDRALSCVHCGLCLPACPTFVQTGQEGDSPRGRIQLMRGLADGVIEPTASVRRHLDLCLDCRGCETACPSGVVYHELIEETRARLAATQPIGVQGRLMRWLFFNVFVYPTRLKLALLPARVLQKLGIYSLFRSIGLFRLLPLQFRKMEQMLPATGALWPAPLRGLPASRNQAAANAPAVPKRIGFFTGCIGSVMFDKVNRQAAELLAACGADVLPLRSQTCCGALHQHSGFPAPAMQFARKNIDAFLPKDGPPVDFITTTISGCGSMLREYDHLLRDDPEYADRARVFASKVRDISEVLLELGVTNTSNASRRPNRYLSRCVPSRARAARHRAAPPASVSDSRTETGSIAGERFVLRRRRNLQPDRAGNVGQPCRAESEEHRQHRRGDLRDGECRLRDADSVAGGCRQCARPRGSPGRVAVSSSFPAIRVHSRN